MSSVKTGIYPGTFDPITNGHLDIIERATHVVDELIVAIAEDIPKTPLFDLEERVEMAQEAVSNIKGAKVVSFGGLLVDFAKEQNAGVIVRGLRAVSDFEYEFQLASINHKMSPEVETIFLPASDNLQFVASSFVKEIARLGGDVSCFVPENVAKKLVS